MRNNPFLAAADEEFPTCPGCSQQVFPKERPLMALGAKWHPGCLKCTSCGCVLTVRMMDSYQKKPYCKAHLPKATATSVSDDFHTKNVAAKPKAARRQQGVDVTARQTFYGTGQLAKGGADAGATFGGGTADSGTYEVAPREERVADAGVAYGQNKSDSGTFENQPEAYDPSMYSNVNNDTGFGPSPTGRVQGAVGRGAAPAPTPASRAPAAAPPVRSAPPTKAAAPPPMAAPPPPVPEETYDQGGYDQGYDQGGDQGGYDQNYDQGGYDQTYDQGGDQGGYDQTYDQGGDQAAYDQNYDEAGYDQNYDQAGHDHNYDQNYDGTT